METAVLRQLLDDIIPIALEAGSRILQVAAQGDAGARAKDDGSPVTRADMASHHAIVSAIDALESDWFVLSEESFEGLASGDHARFSLAPSVTRDVYRYWCIDPLDGTKEFISGNGEYTVNIALVEESRPCLGVIGVPSLGLLYYAVTGAGAWRSEVRSAERDARAIRARAVRLPCSPLPEPGPVGVISRSHPSAETDAYLTANGVREVIRRGSSVKMCAVAEGAADVYPRLAPTWFWDTAAGTVIAREAGCRVVDTAGRDLVYDLSGMLKQEDGFVVLAPNARLRGR